ncbi:MAG: MaoC family dehydratase [Oscillospiraceae bacterium]
MKGMSIGDLVVGQQARVAKTISESDVYLYAGVTGDLNPAHVNEEYAAGTRFGHRIAHGMLSAGLISAVIGMQLPGPGTIYMGQELKFLAPVYPGDTVTATVTVKELDAVRNRATLETVCTNAQGRVLISGQALVMPPVKVEARETGSTL